MKFQYKVINFDPTWWAHTLADELNRQGEQGWILSHIDRTFYIFMKEAT